MKQLPKYHETFMPILKELGDDKETSFSDLRKKIRDKYYNNLPEDLAKQTTRTGKNILSDRIGWGKSYLKMGKFLFYPKRGMVQITQKGKNVLESNKNLTLEDLQNDPDFLTHRESHINKINKEDKQGLKNSSPQDLIDEGFLAIESQIKNELLSKLKEIDPYYFEKIILILLKKMGYGDFIETKKSSDGGIDGIINEDKLGLAKIYIQVKRYVENEVREKDIRNFIGAMSGDTSKGVFVTTSNFNELAINKAREASHNIILIDGERLVDLMYEYGVGLQSKDIYELKEIDEDFFEES